MRLVQNHLIESPIRTVIQVVFLKK